MATQIKFKRGTRANLNTLAAGGDLIAGEPIYITDEDRIAICTSDQTYETFAKESEAGGSGDEVDFNVTRVENTTGSQTIYNPVRRNWTLLDMTNAASTYTITISRKPSSGGTAAFTNVEHYVLIRNTAAAAKTLVIQLETTGDKMDSEGLSAVAIPASGIYEVGYIWVARGTDNLCIITKSTLLSEITK